MSKPINIIGHGIAGTTLAMTCYRRNIPFQIFGQSIQGESSPASSGLIAPVTGRRYVKAWQIDEYIAFALDFYRWTEDILQNEFFSPIEIVRFLSHDEAKKAWEKRSEDQAYAHYISNKRYAYLDVLDRPYGILTGGYRLDTPGWLNAVHAWLLDRHLFQAERINISNIDATPSHIVWATGAVDMVGAYGIIPNKGEALIVRLPEWTIPVAIKDIVFIVPLHDGLFWVGSYYEPQQSDPLPTTQGRDALLEIVKRFHDGPVEVVAHRAGIRPTVRDRRPVIGQHPLRPGEYLFNGMGTKGTSLAPYWADQLLDHLFENKPLPAEVLPSRFLS